MDEIQQQENEFARRVDAFRAMSRQELRYALCYLAGRAPEFTDEAIASVGEIRAEADR